jgi:thymidylate kinase
VIDLVIEGLGKVFEKAHSLNHFRPTLFGNISDVAHSAGLKKEVDDNYSDPHRGGKTGVLSSLARLCYYSVDYILGYWLAVKSKTRITWLVFFDRYFTDIICDSRRTRIYLPIKFLYAWSRILIPSLDYNVLLTVDADTILARKKELTRDEIEAINAKIDFLMARRGVQQVSRKGQYVKVLNDRTPKEAANDILQIIFDAQHRKNSRRI